MRMVRYLSVAILATAIASFGCTHRRPVDPQQPLGIGTAELELPPPPEPEKPRPGNVLTKGPPEAAPGTVSQAIPEYPASALEHRIACAARFLYHIQTDGSATIVRIEWDSAPPVDHVDAFESAIRDAVATWEFISAYQVRYRERADGTLGFEKHLIPKARYAVVRFRVEDGQAVVE